MYDGWQLFPDTCCSVCLFSQIAMRGPPGPMGLTGRPGPVYVDKTGAQV